jgi:hypothetical protein
VYLQFSTVVFNEAHFSKTIHKNINGYWGFLLHCLIRAGSPQSLSRFWQGLSFSGGAPERVKQSNNNRG